MVCSELSNACIPFQCISEQQGTFGCFFDADSTHKYCASLILHHDSIDVVDRHGKMVDPLELLRFMMDQHLSMKVLHIQGNISSDFCRREIEGENLVRAAFSSDPLRLEMYTTYRSFGGSSCFDLRLRPQSSKLTITLNGAAVNSVFFVIQESCIDHHGWYGSAFVDTASMQKDILESLEIMHRVVVHKDIKPGNIVLCGGRFKLIDFGVSRALTSPELAHIEGTPLYRSPFMTGPHDALKQAQIKYFHIAQNTPQMEWLDAQYIRASDKSKPIKKEDAMHLNDLFALSLSVFRIEAMRAKPLRRPSQSSSGKIRHPPVLRKDMDVSAAAWRHAWAIEIMDAYDDNIDIEFKKCPFSSAAITPRYLAKLNTMHIVDFFGGGKLTGMITRVVFVDSDEPDGRFAFNERTGYMVGQMAYGGMRLWFVADAVAAYTGFDVGGRVTIVVASTFEELYECGMDDECRRRLHAYYGDRISTRSAASPSSSSDHRLSMNSRSLASSGRRVEWPMTYENGLVEAGIEKHSVGNYYMFDVTIDSRHPMYDTVRLSYADVDGVEIKTVVRKDAALMVGFSTKGMREPGDAGRALVLLQKVVDYCRRRLCTANSRSLFEGEVSWTLDHDNGVVAAAMELRSRFSVFYLYVDDRHPNFRSGSPVVGDRLKRLGHTIEWRDSWLTPSGRRGFVLVSQAMASKDAIALLQAVVDAFAYAVAP